MGWCLNVVPLDLVSPVTTTSVTATTVTLFFTQPEDTLNVDQYRVTLTRRLGHEQLMCPSLESTVARTTVVDYIPLEGLEEYSVYSVSIFTINLLAGLRRTFTIPDITTLSAGGHSGCVESGT